MTTVSDCLTKCVGLTGKVFCPSDDKNSGYCCSNVLNCPRASTLNYCSSDFKNSTTLQQYMCPYESTYCGPSSILTGQSKIQYLTISNVSSSSQLNLYPNSGGACTYRFVGPSNMTAGEALLVRIESLFQVSMDIVTTNMFNLSQTSSE